jgi:DNA-binding winged helix-turn-helix (wHTH) protein
MDLTGRRRFDDYEIDLGTAELRRNGRPIPLQRQPARVLVRLVASAGTLVPREDLQAAVWGGDVHVDFNRGLNYCIRQLRQAFGDDPKAPRFIETVARQGYRFVAAVRPVDCFPPTIHRLPSTVPASSLSARVAHLACAARSGRAAGVASEPRPTRRWPLALAALVTLGVGLAADRLAGGNAQHHEMALLVARAVHDFVF